MRDAHCTRGSERAEQARERKRKREEVENMTLEWFASLTLPPPPKTRLSFFSFCLITSRMMFSLSKSWQETDSKKMRECYPLKSVDTLAPYWLHFTWPTSPTLLVQCLKRSTNRSQFSKLTSIAKNRTLNWKMSDMLRLGKTFSFRQACWDNKKTFFNKRKFFSVST